MAQRSIDPSWRKPVGALGILLWILGWIILIASFSHQMSALPALAQLPIYLIAGMVWILPLKPVLLWMETGRWRA